MPLTHRKRASSSSANRDFGGAEMATDGAAAAEQLATALTLEAEFGGGRLLLSDLRTAFLLANHARLRVIARMFGVSPEQANLLTAVAVLTLAQTAQAKARWLLRGPPVPSLGSGIFAGNAVGDVLRAVAGSPARDTPFAGMLLAAAVLWARGGPATVKSARAISAGSHRAALGFHHRYGYIVDPGHWRQRRARRAEAAHALRTAA